MTYSVYHFVAMTPNKRGPLELQLVEQARQMREDGAAARHFFTGPVPDWYRQLLADAGSCVEVLSDWQDVASVCRIGRPDLAHFHFGRHNGIAPQLRRMGIRVVRTEHSYRAKGSLAPLRAVLRRHRSASVDHFIAVSDYVARQTRRDFLITPRRVTRIYNGADLERFRLRPDDREQLRLDLLGIDDDRPVITVAAHLHPNKRQAMLIEAMPTVIRRHPMAHLVIAGGGETEAALRALVAATGLSENVSIQTANNDVAALYAASDVAVLPSAGEGLGGSAVEAMACGLPLVVTPCGGLAEVPEDGVTGLLVHDQTPHGLAAALVPLLDDAGMRDRMGRAGRLRAERLFDVRRAARETLALYRTVLAG